MLLPLPLPLHLPPAPSRAFAPPSGSPVPAASVGTTAATKAIGAGACVAVVTAMRNFPGDEDIQADGCASIPLLMAMHPPSVRVFVALGTAPVLAAAAAMFPRNEGLQARVRSAQAALGRG
jgi:hypothetical protein